MPSSATWDGTGHPAPPPGRLRARWSRVEKKSGRGMMVEEKETDGNEWKKKGYYYGDDGRDRSGRSSVVGSSAAQRDAECVIITQELKQHSPTNRVSFGVEKEGGGSCAERDAQCFSYVFIFQ